MKRIAVLIVVLLIVGVGALALNQSLLLHKAHSSLVNYAAFRGCTKLLSQTNTSAVCQLSSGQKITLVTFQGKWYLKGDLPVCLGNICF